MFSYFKKSDKIPKSLVDSSSNITKEAEWQLERSSSFVRKLSQRYPNLWIVAGGAGAAFVLLGLKEFYHAQEGEKEIKFRASQLAQAPHVLNGDEAVNFPWNQSNLNDWLYRPVVITGRPRHSQAMLVPRKVDKYHGYDYIVPLITKENDDGTEEHGILLNKGWIPHEYRHVGSRLRIENADPQTFLAYVSTQSELDYTQKFFKDGNSPKAVRNHWDHVYLPDMADATGFKNAKQMKLALLEVVDPNRTKLDERDPTHYSKSLTVEEDYPYAKTYAGALQLYRMPWSYKSGAWEYLSLGTASTLIALGLKFL